MDLKSEGLSSNPSPSAYYLCDLRQVMSSGPQFPHLKNEEVGCSISSNSKSVMQ